MNSELNVAASLATFIVTSAIGLAMTPFLIHGLGLATYSLIPLAFAVLATVSFFAQTASNSFARLFVETRKSPEAANAVFSSAVLLVAVAAALVILLALFASPFFVSAFAAGHASSPEAATIFVATAIGVAAGFVALPAQGINFSHNRIYLNALCQMIQPIARAVVIVAGFLYLEPSIEIVAGAIVAGAIASLAVLYLVLVRSDGAPNLRFALVDRSIYKKLGTTAGGVLFIQIGTVLLFNMDVVLLGLMRSAEIAGLYASINVLGATLRGLGLTLAGTFSPRLMTAGIESDRLGILLELRRAMALTLFVMAYPCGVAASYGADILGLWLGPQFAAESLTLGFLAAGALATIAAIPAGALNLAANRVYLPGAWTVGSALGFMLIAIFVAPEAAHPVPAMAACLAATQAILSLGLTIPYAVIGYRLAWAPVAAIVVRGFFWLVFAIAASLAAKLVIAPQGWFTLMASVALAGVLYGSAFPTLPREARDVVQSRMARIFASRRP
ncbi:MAG: oligosaccharide flippase family protein [Hyphomicrobium sp.]|nr:oligosaccharide flippase family protein [Hyphomicrobium sp.]